MNQFFKVHFSVFVWALAHTVFNPSVSVAGSPLGFTCMLGKTPNRPTQSCIAALPQCSELVSGKPAVGDQPAVTGIIEEVKNLLSYQIWGYYNNINLDLNHSRYEVNSKAGWVGVPFPHTICSPVGDKLQVPAGRTRAADVEFTKQNIGAKEPCGNFLAFQRTDKWGATANFDVLFNKDSGGLVAAHNYSALIWTIRYNAWKVLGQIKDSTLGDLSLILKDVAEGPEGAAVMQQLSALSDNEIKLSDKEKDSCNKDLDSKNICEKLDVTDPAQRVCSLKKARIMLGRGALPALIVRQIMINAEKDFKRYFILHPVLNTSINSLFNKCLNAPRATGSRTSQRACAVSCIAGVTDEVENGSGGKNWYCVGGSHDRDIRKGDCENNTHQRSCWVNGRANITDQNKVSMQGEHKRLNDRADSFNYPIADSSYSVLSGMSGAIEATIRRYCKQTRITDPSPCDEVGIPAVPKGWTP